MLFQDLVSKADKDASAEISFTEFLEYMEEHERKLKLAFSDLDRNKDGNLVKCWGFSLYEELLEN